MKSFKFLRTAPGVALAMAIIATTSVSTYALTNWFNANVIVKHSNSVLTVNLSKCKGNLPPGIDPSTDRSNVQFRILGEPHISTERLEQQLLAECEYNAVIDFYGNSATQSHNLYPSTVKAVAGNVITLDYLWGGKINEKTFTLAAGATIYNEGKQVTLQDIKVGDRVIFSTIAKVNMQEGVDPLESVSKVTSIFKTQYDTKDAPGATKKAFYPESNIMPLDMYNRLHK